MGEVETMSFSKALELIKQGKKMARVGWNGKGMCVEIQFPDDHSKMGLAYIYLKTATGLLCPWSISNSDALTDDWVVVE